MFSKISLYILVLKVPVPLKLNSRADSLKQ